MHVETHCIRLDTTNAADVIERHFERLPLDHSCVTAYLSQCRFDGPCSVSQVQSWLFAWLDPSKPQNPPCPIGQTKPSFGRSIIIDDTAIGSYDVVVDCTDNVVTRYIVNDLCCVLAKPLVSGSALRLEGQARNRSVSPVEKPSSFLRQRQARPMMNH